VSVTGNSAYLVFNYQISSSKIELVVLQSKAGNTEALKLAMEDTDEYVVDGWRGFKYALDSDADAIQIVAKKTGITLNIEFVLIDRVAIRSDLETGNTPLLYCRSICLLSEKSIIFAIRRVILWQCCVKSLCHTRPDVQWLNVSATS